MLKFFFAGAVASLALVSACATGSAIVNDGPVPDSGTGKDTSVPTDSGNTNPDSGKPDTSTDMCMKSAPSNVCGVDPQCDCGATQTCDVDVIKLDGSSACVAAGSTPAGGSCTATANQCAPGLTCIWRVCRPYCGATGADNPCTTSGTCIQLTDMSMKPIPNLLVCSIDCALDNPTSCPAPDGCIYRGGTTNASDCYPVGTSSTCSATQPNCSPGNVCATVTATDGGMSYQCLQWCKVSAPACSGSKTCYSFSTKVIVGGTEYGACQ